MGGLFINVNFFDAARWGQLAEISNWEKFSVK